jgi:hypothetical protein
VRGAKALTDLQRHGPGGAISLLRDRAGLAVIEPDTIDINRSESGDDTARDLQGRCLERAP